MSYVKTLRALRDAGIPESIIADAALKAASAQAQAPAEKLAPSPRVRAVKQVQQSAAQRRLTTLYTPAEQQGIRVAAKRAATRCDGGYMARRQAAAIAANTAAMEANWAAKTSGRPLPYGP